MGHLIKKSFRGGMFLTAALAVFLVAAGATAKSTGSADSAETAANQPWKWAVLAGGNYGITWGDYYRGTSRNFGYGLSVTYRLSHRFALMGSASKVGITVNSDPTIISNGTELEYMYRYYDVSANRVVVSLLGGSTFQLESFKEKGIGRSFAALGVGLGVTRFEQYVGAILFPVPPIGGYELPISDTQTKFTATINLMFSQMLTGRVGIYIAQDADFVFLGNASDSVVHWRAISGVVFMDHIRFGLTAFF